MTGIDTMFAELSGLGDEPDWFQLAFVFERARETRLEKQRERQRLIDWRRRGGPPGKRGRRSLGLTPEQMRERRKAQNRKAGREWWRKNKMTTKARMAA